ncbi:MAG: glycosyl transferase, partial [Firmicutes bacterium]|nr:glycosyl transferase [Bacillota bacterium]
MRHREVDLVARVLIGSAVRQKPQVLDLFLRSITGLDTAGLDVEYVFIDDNLDCDESSGMLRGFARSRSARMIQCDCPAAHYVCDEITHHWQEDLVWRVASHKDRLLDMARDGRVDFIFLVDSDLVLHPRTLVHLVSLGLEVVSEVYWTKWEPNFPPLPQVWIRDQYTLYRAGRGESLGQQEVAQR